MLSDKQIKAAVKRGDICIEPFDEDRVQPASYDVKTSSSWATIATAGFSYLDVKRDYAGWTRRIISHEIMLKPRQMVLGSTVEYIALNDRYAARLEGKSSLARMGLLVHTAGFVDPGFRGQLTLEISNLLDVPIKIYSGMPIAQLCFMKMSGQVDTPYCGHYQDQKGATPSRFHEALSEAR